MDCDCASAALRLNGTPAAAATAAEENKKRRRSSMVASPGKQESQHAGLPSLRCQEPRGKDRSALHSSSLAAGDHGGRIEGIAILLHLHHLAIFVYQVGHAPSSLVGRVIDAVFPAGIAAHIA